MIIMNDFKRQWEQVGPLVLDAVQAVGQSGWYILGEEVNRFEQGLLTFFPVQHAIGVANGMDALEIALRVLQVKPEDRVLTTPLSAFATTLSILRVGATPVFADVDQNGLIDLDQVEAILQKRPDIRFFMPVHLYGLSLDLEHLSQICQKYSVSLIEDCAQSIGAKFKGQFAGTVGKVACTSFYPTKNLGAMGDGGAFLTSDSELAARARSIRNYGQSEHYVHSEFGLNSRLDELQASILRRAFLPQLSLWNKRRKEIASRYLHEIKNPNIELLKVSSEVDSVWHLFPVLVSAAKRADFQAHLKKKEVASGIHYPHLISNQKALHDYGKFEVIGELKNAEKFASHEVSLPIHPLLTEEEVSQVIEACNQWQG